MELMAPPEELSKERFARLDERFSDVNRRFDEVGRKFDAVDWRITEAKEETRDRFNRVEGDIGDLKKSVEAVQATLTRMSFGLALTFASVLITSGM